MFKSEKRVVLKKYKLVRSGRGLTSLGILNKVERKFVKRGILFDEILSVLLEQEKIELGRYKVDTPMHK